MGETLIALKTTRANWRTNLNFAAQAVCFLLSNVMGAVSLFHTS